MPKKQRTPRILLTVFFLLFLFLIGAILWCGISLCQNVDLFSFEHILSSQPALPDSSAASAAPHTDSEPEEWALVLVNYNHPLPENHQIQTVTLSNGERVDERIYSALQKMFDDMRKDGIYPIVASGYRTTQEQQQIMNNKIEEFKRQGYSSAVAKKKAEEWVAIPGTSEHELGLAVDINADGIHSTGQEVYDWLLKNSARYGFIKRYPQNKTHITKISNEPWHYRYVGVKAATEITNQHLCLEEYLQKQ